MMYYVLLSRSDRFWSINKTIMIPRQQVCFLWDIEAVLVDDFIVVQKEMPDFIVVMFASV